MNRRTMLRRLGIGIATTGLLASSAGADDCDPPDNWSDCILDSCNEPCPATCCGLCAC